MVRETPQTGEIYHVYNRGANKADIFHDAIDISRFLEGMKLFNTIEPTGGFFVHYKDILGSQTSQYNARNHRIHTEDSGKYLTDDALVRILSYSLQPNHFHMLLEQLVDGGISEYMRRVGGGYTKFKNERHDQSGVVFQGIYKRKHLSSDECLRYLIAYVNCNDVVHDVSFAFPISPRLAFLTSSKQEYVSGTPGLCGIAKLKEYVGNTLFWNDADVLAREIRQRRDLEKLLCE